MCVAAKRCCTTIVLAATLTIVLAAQPSVEVYHDDNNRADTVLDFGVTLEGYPVTLPVYVRNTGNVDVGILLANPNADPYYQIINTYDISPSDPRKEEFEGVEGLPYLVKANTTDTFHIVYKALKNNPVFPPDVVAKALLELRVVSMQDTLGKAVFKRFLLLALKTKFSVATNKPVIKFDSVYVNPSPQPPTTQYSIVNASSIPIPIENQRTTFFTSIVGNPEIVVDTLATPILAPHKGLTWNVQYRPHNTGFDSAHFTVVYRPNQSSEADSVTTEVSGVGVLQDISIVNANGEPPPIQIKTGTIADTVDFGDVDADGSGGKLARIVLKNKGNLHVRFNREYKLGLPVDTTAFIVERPMMTGGLDIRTNEFDTLLVRFKPTNGGVHIMNYVIETDLLSRPIQSIPDGAQRKVLVLRGFARKPQIDVAPRQLDFGTVVLLQDCPSATERSLLVRNVGNILLRIDSVRTNPPSSVIQVQPPDPIQPIDVDGSLTLTVRYQPNAIETLNNELVMYTNAFGPPITIPLSGSSIRSDSISVRIPTVKTRPGTVAQVPVLVDADRVQLTQTSNMTIAFDPTMLRYRGTITSRTASEGSSFITQSESPRGVLHLQMRATGLFSKRDTFIVVLFDTYLGKSASTELSLKPQTTMFGNDGCSNLLTVSTTSGIYQTDSVCGLDFKTNTSGLLRLQVYPNPTSTFLFVQTATELNEPIELQLFDAYGQTLPVPLNKELGGFDLRACPPGVYVVSAVCGNHYARHLVVKQ